MLSAKQAMGIAAAAFLGAATATNAVYRQAGKEKPSEDIYLKERSFLPYDIDWDREQREIEGIRYRQKQITKTCAFVTFIPAAVISALLYTRTGSFALFRCAKSLRTAERALFDAKISVREITHRPVAKWSRDLHNNYDGLINEVFKRQHKFVENPLAPLSATYKALKQQECDLTSTERELKKALGEYNDIKQKIAKVDSSDADQQREVYGLIDLDDLRIREELEKIKTYRDFATDTKKLLQQHPQYLEAFRLERVEELIRTEKQVLAETKRARESADSAAFWAMTNFLLND